MDQLWLSEQWEAVDFPLINSKSGSWHNKNATLTGLKALLQRENLKQYKDFVIVVNPEYKDYRSVTVRFKEEGQGLILLFYWIASNYYKERS